MHIELTRELKGVYRPAKLDKLTAAAFAVWAVVFIAGLVDTSRTSGGFDRSLAAVSCLIVLFALFMADVNLRTVTIDDETVAQRSPLGIYRQRFKHTDLSGIRVRGPRGGAAEVCYQGRWIFFCSNRTFRRRIKEWAKQGAGGHAPAPRASA